MVRFVRIALFAAALGLPGCVITSTQPVASYAVPDVSGVYNTTWGANVATLTLQQNGANVVGSYVTTGAPPGNVSGSLSQNILTGSWVDQAGSSGGFQFVFAADGRSFRGTWGMGSSIASGGNWDGVR